MCISMCAPAKSCASTAACACSSARLYSTVPLPNLAQLMFARYALTVIREPNALAACFCFVSLVVLLVRLLLWLHDLLDVNLPVPKRLAWHIGITRANDNRTRPVPIPRRRVML